MGPTRFALTIATAAIIVLQATWPSSVKANSYKETVLYSFGIYPDGQQPSSGVLDIHGALYGTTYAGGGDLAGTIFSVDADTGAEQVLHSFDDLEVNSEGDLINIGGTLYGTTVGSDDSGSSGTVFAFDINAKTESSVYNFCGKPLCADGANPVAGLINLKRVLYGTTQGGGASASGCGGIGCGTVFSLDLKTGAEKVLYSFCTADSCKDGRWPSASLIDVDGILYGTAEYGGLPGCIQNIGCGVVFSIDPTTGVEKLLYSFCSIRNCADGANPHAGLVYLNGLLYGTTGSGGRPGCDDGCGTVFSLDPANGAENVVYAFCRNKHCKDGAEPWTGLANLGGMLFGTTAMGGGEGCSGSGCGTAFALDPNTGEQSVIYAFLGGSDGQLPNRLIAAKGKLYGTTLSGGTSGNGTVFMLKAKH